MEYSRIVAVTGMPGLYEVVSSKTDGAIVRALEDGSSKFVSSRVHNLSHLESIEIYTTGENVSLSDVFAAMKNSPESLPDVKDNKALTEYFKKAFPELDFERVYASDMKKLVNWFKIIQQHDVDFTPKAEEEENSSDEQSNVAETLEAAGEKVVLDVDAESVPEVAKKKTTRKKKSTE